MRRSTFDRWFNEQFKRAHKWSYSDRFILVPPWIELHPVAKHDDVLAVVAKLEKRVKALECPGHDYTSDTCRLCGHKKEADDDA